MKRLNKRILSIFLSLVLMITTLFSINLPIASAATYGAAGVDVTWYYDSSTKTLTLSGTGPTYDFRATNIATNKRVPWQDYKPELTNIVIGEGITRIGQYAFYNCTALTNVSLPSTLQEIGGMGTMTTSYGAFQGCTALASIRLNEGLTKIENCAFKNCTSLVTLTLPSTLTELGYGAFSECTKLTSLTFGGGLKETGNNSFYNCTGLKTVNWNGVERISTYSFYGFFGASVDFPESVKYIGFRSFAENYNLRNITINNPDCDIVTSNLTEEVSPFAGHQQDVTIHGHSGSTAQALATTYNYTFVSLDPCDHTNTYENVAVAATCTEIGTLQTICSDCGQIVATSEIAALGHDYQEVDRLDQTTENGHIYITQQCSRCSEVKDVIEHARTGLTSPRYVWVEGYYTYTNTATCTKPGVERYVCTVEGCTMTNNLNNNIQTQETISASLASHTVENWEIVTPATCLEDGSKKGVCTVCGAETTEVIPATGHTYSTEEGSADLIEIIPKEDTEDGHNYSVYQCQNCEEQILIPEHIDWVEGFYTATVISQAHCVIDGLERDVCNVCGLTRNVTLPANGQHVWVETKRTEPSCTVAGQIYYACENCTMTKTERTEALGHDYVKVDESSKLPTCTESGYDFERCSRCSATRQVVVPATGHTVDENNKTIVSNPTCVDDGSALSVCTVCGTGFEVTIPATGHTYVDKVTDLTFENKPGHSLVTPVCSVCKERQPGTMRHDEWLEGYYTTEDTLQSTCIIQGYTTDTCTICNTTRRNYKSALGHNYNYVGDNNATSNLLASVTYEGMLYRCSICQSTYRAMVADVLRQWEWAEKNSRDIRRTGNPDEIQDWSSLVDANGDGIINAKDYAILKRCDKKQKELIEIEKQKTYVYFGNENFSYQFDMTESKAKDQIAPLLPADITLTDLDAYAKIGDLPSDIEVTSEAYENIRLLVAGDVLIDENKKIIVVYKNKAVNGNYIRLGRVGSTDAIEENFANETVTVEFGLVTKLQF